MAIVSIWSALVAAGGKILVALLALIIGNLFVKGLLKVLSRSRGFQKLDSTVRSFSLSFAKGLLYVLLGIIVIGILGVPMASVITVLASCGVAVGLALQGALSNLAGGIMLMLFRPFQVGSFVEASGVSGTVQDITLFYTVILTVDNCRVTVPNGSLMNANITDYSAEALRRVDLTFTCAKTEDPAKVQDLMRQVMDQNEKVLKDPAPFARLSGATDTAMEFTLRAWCQNADYWDVHFDLTQHVTEAFGQNSVQAPVQRIAVQNG